MRTLTVTALSIAALTACGASPTSPTPGSGHSTGPTATELARQACATLYHIAGDGNFAMNTKIAHNLVAQTHAARVAVGIARDAAAKDSRYSALVNDLSQFANGMAQLTGHAPSRQRNNILAQMQHSLAGLGRECKPLVS